MNAIYNSGFVQALVAPLHYLLLFFHNTLSLSWGWAIVALVIVVRLATVPLTVRQQQSMRKMMALQPEIKKLQAKHQGDRQALNQATMEFYRENKVNPLSSCLPMLVQIPVFFALYVTLKNVQKDILAGQDASFYLVPNIATPINHLPTSTLVILFGLYAGSQIGSTLLMPTTADPRQKYIFLAMPIVFIAFLWNSAFPAGMMIYWITSNLWTMGQAYVIRRWYPPPQLATAAAGKGSSGAKAPAKKKAAAAKKGKR